MAAMIALLIAAAAPPLPSELAHAWAEFSRKPALQRIQSTVEIGTLGLDRRRNQLDFWLRRVRVVRGRETIGWTDSRTCPAVRPAIAALRQLPVPPVAPPGLSTGGDIILDGIGYSLRAPTDSGEITIRSNIGTPLADWIEATSKALEPCWRSTVPRRNRN